MYGPAKVQSSSEILDFEPFRRFRSEDAEEWVNCCVRNYENVSYTGKWQSCLSIRIPNLFREKCSV